MKIQTAKELAAACVDVAKNYRTLYVRGAFGWPMNDHNKQRAMNSYSYNSAADRAKKIKAAAKDTFGFDCVNFLKALLWGWEGDPGQNYGGAKYASNGVPDCTEAMMIDACGDVTTDFSGILPGEAVWLPGHIGIYVGDGLAVECTPTWADGVQLTACNRDVPGYPRRDWVKHGKLPYVTYPQTAGSVPGELSRGCKGTGVKALQILLIGWGYPCGAWGADGDFGPGTENAVKLFQKAKKLTPDGIVGPLTWAALLGCDGR